MTVALQDARRVGRARWSCAFRRDNFVSERLSPHHKQLPTTVRMHPIFPQPASRVVTLVEVSRPLEVTRRRGIGPGRHRPARRKLDLIARSTPGAGNLQHECSGGPQCATPEAAPSSMSAPVAKRSSLKAAASSSDLSRARRWAKERPPPGIALKPPVPQPVLM